jgi:hypothetical protein
MKKIVILFLVLFFNQLSAQFLTETEKNFLKAVRLEKSDDSRLQGIQQANFYWDFSNFNLQNKTVNIEVISFYDCFNGTAGTQIANQFVANEKHKTKGKSSFNLIEMGTKCFKWRLVIKENLEEKASEWYYFTFLTN